MVPVIGQFLDHDVVLTAEPGMVVSISPYCGKMMFIKQFSYGITMVVV